MRGPRPASVTLVTTLVYLYGLGAIALGIAIIVGRDATIPNAIVSVLSLEGSLPFDRGSDATTYLLAAGVTVIGFGVVVAVLAALLARGSRVAYVVLLGISAVLTGYAVLGYETWTDDFALWGADGLLVASAVILVALVLLLVLRRARRFLWADRG